MEPMILFLLILTLFAVTGVLLLGILSMMRGGDWNKKYSNRLMQWRVGLQGLSLILLASLWLLS